MKVRTGRAVVNGVTIAYDDAGAGEPLVLVHGHPFDRSMWAPQIAALAGPARRVVVPDLRGYGESGVVPGTTPLGAFARDIAALLDHLGLDRAVIGGLSMGGQIVMEFYRLFPERVRGLLLADTFAGADTAEGRRARRGQAERLLREGMGPYAEEVLTKMIAPYNVAARPEVAAHVLGMMRAAPPAGAAAALRGRAERPCYGDLLGTVTVPTLVVVGRDDEFTPVSDAEYMRDRVPGAALVVIEGAAHLPNLERPRRFNQALRGLLSAVEDAAALAS
ncbi:alpha/beta hydrolase [Sphaerisporangium krabiense]|uniref:Pimeloyl-ACP methyl ester carboxylesterase n=1 Tax=Sphaerisporangium krabiense TaxID=763782 RepID=A0A7W8ZC33_9ACTN|nr:alpha/beta fold hydrolase [Sphaerisporangium krabiense]MBB5631264.1 pimeloyl-ACP methyl ester carboxylesterase [Sphaerisporangium krabiense]GII61123.1 alpha/beta hydrolase [Sphaerisporangium krabiense]